MFRRITGTVCLLLVSLATVVFAGPVTATTEPPRRVLLLDSFGRNVAPISTVISTFRTELTSRSPGPIDLHEVSLEMARFAQPEQEAPFVNFLKDRFQHYQPDLVVSAGRPAAIFMERHRDLFPGVPLVVAAVPELILQSSAPLPNSAVVPLVIRPDIVVEDILAVLPGTRHIEVVLGTSPNEAFWVEECRREFVPFADRVTFNYLNGLSFEAIRDRLAALPAGSAVFYGMLLVDGGGVPYDPSEALKTIVGSANAPVFAPNESYLGLGIVGGRFVQERAAGVRAADVALRILAGERAESIRTPALSAERSVYDWREMKRWGIGEARLPAGSLVLYREPTPWEHYRAYILVGSMLLVVQGGLIAGLLVQRRRSARAERRLLQSEHRLRLITNSLPVLIAYVDADERYRFANAAYAKWFGLEPAAVMGREIGDVVGPAFHRTIRPHVVRVLAGEHVHYAHDTELPDGSRISIEGVYVPDADERGAVRGFYAMVMDVTERNLAQQESRRLQDELLHASRISTMGELAGTLAHEINQPLAAIMSNAQAARRFLESAEPDLDEVKEILNDIAGEGARAGEVINRLRAFLRKSTTDFEPVDVNGIIREVVGFVHSDAVARDVRIELELAPTLPPVSGDRIQLQQVVLNLVLNGFEAMNGHLRAQRRLHVRTALRGGMVHAVVTDSGGGVPEAEAESVFKPFYTTKRQGLGMGLSISRSIIHRHEGRIWVESPADQGAAFHFTLRPIVGDGQTEGA